MVGPGLLWQTPLVAAVPYSSPFNCLLTASSSPLPASVLWTLSSVTKPLPTPQLHISGWRNQVLARTLWAGLSPFCPSQRVVVLSSDPVILLFCPAWSSHQWGGFPGCKLFFFFSSLPGAQVSSCFHFHFFPIVPSSYIETFPVLSGMWGLLLIFYTCSVRIFLFEDVSLMTVNIWVESVIAMIYLTSRDTQEGERHHHLSIFKINAFKNQNRAFLVAQW